MRRKVATEMSDLAHYHSLLVINLIVVVVHDDKEALVGG
jgi:hypothetical protein